MSNQSGPPIPRVLSGRLAGLSYGQLAVALCASDMPDQCDGEVALAQVAEWALQGVGLLGEARVKELEERVLHIDASWLGGGLSNDEHAAQTRLVWRSIQRHRLSQKLAYQLRFRGQLRQSASP